MDSNAGQETARERAEPSHTPRWPQHSGMTWGLGAAGAVDMTEKEKAAERGRILRVKEEGLRMRDGRRVPEKGRDFIAEAMEDGGRVGESYARRSWKQVGEVYGGQPGQQARDAVSTSPLAAAGRHILSALGTALMLITRYGCPCLLSIIPTPAPCPHPPPMTSVPRLPTNVDAPFVPDVVLGCAMCRRGRNHSSS